MKLPIDQLFETLRQGAKQGIIINLNISHSKHRNNYITFQTTTPMTDATQSTLTYYLETRCEGIIAASVTATRVLIQYQQ